MAKTYWVNTLLGKEDIRALFRLDDGEPSIYRGNGTWEPYDLLLKYLYIDGTVQPLTKNLNTVMKEIDNRKPAKA